MEGQKPNEKAGVVLLVLSAAVMLGCAYCYEQGKKFQREQEPSQSPEEAATLPADKSPSESADDSPDPDGDE